jgi:hypothetical protein
MTGFATLSSREMRAILKAQVEMEKAAAETERAAAFADVLQPVFDAVVLTEPYTDSDKAGSTWAGFDSRAHKLVVDGNEYTVSIRITNVKRTAEKTATLEQQARDFLAKQAATSVEG